MTSSGIVGKIENVKDRYVLIRLGDNVTINMQKEFISSLLPKVLLIVLRHSESF